MGYESILFFVVLKGEIIIQKKNTNEKSCDNLMAYSMKLALLNQLLKLNKITEQEYSMIKAKIKLEHKIV